MRGASLIVLAWNQWPLTRRCLDSLLATDLDHAEIIVVDNGSSDDTPSGLAAYAGRLRTIRLDANLGFVRGMNAGIAAARPGNDVVLLNNDLEFSQADWLGRLRDAAYAAADHGIVGCRLLGPPPRSLLFHAGGFFDAHALSGQQTESGRQERELNQYPRLRRVSGIAFAVAYLRRDCIERIGALDEAFHSYFEDTDYCLRARDAGIAAVVAGNVTLRHHQHGSTRDDGGFRARLYAQSRATFAARWQQRLLARTRGELLWHGPTRLPTAQALLTHGLVGRLGARDLGVCVRAPAHEVVLDEDYRVVAATQRACPSRIDAALAVGAGPPQLPATAAARLALLWSEWERLPADWVDACHAFDRLLVPDEVQAAILRDSGVRTPIDVLDPGIDREYLHPQVHAPRHPHGHQVFLAIVEHLQRDAPERLVQAFQAAFSAGDAVELVVHIIPGDDAEAIHARLAAMAAPGRGRVRLLHGWNFPVAERGQLHAAADVYVSTRRGAGWDPFVREAAACGLAVAAPAWGSQQDFIRRWGWPLLASESRADPDTPGAHWREVDAASLHATLRELFEHREEVAARARANAAEFAAQHHLDLGADRLIDLLDRAGVLKPAPEAAPPHRPGAAGAHPEQIVVLGMHRSGTSSIGGLLALFGAWPGPAEHLLRGDDNPKGHFEHGELHMACLRRLAAAGGDWKRPPREAPPAAVDAFRREAAAVLDTLDARRPWFIKEPRLCLLARELLPLLTAPVFVHVVREPLAVADSLARRDDMDRDEALALWEHYTREAFATSAGWKRVLVDYDALLADPVTVAGTLFDDLVEAGVQGLQRPAAAAIRDWIEAPARAPAATPGASLDAAQAALQAAISDRSILARHHDA